MSKQYRISRITRVDATPEKVRGLIHDLRAWQQWSPWEGLDPAMHREITGPQTGVGARSAWRGNRKAGRGAMQIIRDDPDQVEILVVFEKPFPSRSTSSFLLRPAGDATEVEWQMVGEQNRLMRVLSPVLSMDRLLGKDLEKGLAQLKTVAQR